MKPINVILQKGSNQLTRQISARWGDGIGIYPVIEYPKCGGTWLSRMLSLSLQVPFAQYARLPVAMPSVVHGHWKYHSRLKNVTYLTRDGRDVMVSFYFHFSRPTHNPNHAKNQEVYMQKLKGILGQDADVQDVRTNLPRFIEHIFANPIACKQNWRDHVASWWGRPGVSTVRYESLIEDCEGTMMNLVQSLGQEADPDQVKLAVDQYSMKRATGRNPGEEDKSSFIRKGIVGDWKNHFSRESAEVFDQLAGDMLVELGYESDRTWVDGVE